MVTVKSGAITCALWWAIGGAIIGGFGGGQIPSIIASALMGGSFGFILVTSLFGTGGAALGWIGGAIIGGFGGARNVFDSPVGGNALTDALLFAVALGIFGLIVGAITAKTGSVFRKS